MISRSRGRGSCSLVQDGRVTCSVIGKSISRSRASREYAAAVPTSANIFISPSNLFQGFPFPSSIPDVPDSAEGAVQVRTNRPFRQGPLKVDGCAPSASGIVAPFREAARTHAANVFAPSPNPLAHAAAISYLLHVRRPIQLPAHHRVVYSRHVFGPQSRL